MAFINKINGLLIGEEGPPSFLNGWIYRKALSLSRPSGVLTNYPVMIKVHRSSGTDNGSDVYVGTKCLANYNDIRFTLPNGVVLDHWVEMVDSPRGFAVIWVEFDTIGTGQTNFYMYYGNGGSGDVSNGLEVFTLFDDFNSGSLDTNKWQTVNGNNISISNGVLSIVPYNSSETSCWTKDKFGQGYAFRTKMKYSDNWMYWWAPMWSDNKSDRVPNSLSFNGRANVLTWEYLYNNGLSVRDENGYSNLASGLWFITDIAWVNNNLATFYHYKIDPGYDTDTRNWTDPAYIPQNTVTMWAGARASLVSVYWDWALIRKVVYPEPAFGAWGVEEGI